MFFLKLSLWKGIVHFIKQGKLSLQYIGLYKIIDIVGPVAYYLSLLEEISRIHDVFYVFLLRKYLLDLPHVLKDPKVVLSNDLSYKEQLVQIIDYKEQVLRIKTILLIKVF